MILEAPEGRRVEALRRDQNYASGHVTLIDRAGREVTFGLDAAAVTGNLLVAASCIATGLLDTVDVPALHRAVECELARQIAQARSLPTLADAITRAHRDATA